MSLLAQVSKTKHAAPPRILIHGAEKTGKSSFAAGAPNPIFIRTEDGLNGIDANAFPLAMDAETVRQQLLALVKEDHDYKTVVVDSLDWLERLIFDAVCKRENVDNIARAGGGYGAGYIIALNLWKVIFGLLDRLNREKGMIVICICHSRVVTIQDPLHEPYDKATVKLYSPKSGSGAADLATEWADIIGYAKRPMLVSDGKAFDDGQNILILGGNPGCVAGNRFGLPDEIPFTWSAFNKAMRKIAAPKKTEEPTTETTEEVQE